MAWEIIGCFARTVKRYLCWTQSASSLIIAPTAIGAPSAFKVPVRKEQQPVHVVSESNSDAIPMCNEGKTVCLIQCRVSGEMGDETGKISCACTIHKANKRGWED